MGDRQQQQHNKDNPCVSCVINVCDGVSVPLCALWLCKGEGSRLIVKMAAPDVQVLWQNVCRVSSPPPRGV